MLAPPDCSCHAYEEVLEGGVCPVILAEQHSIDDAKLNFEHVLCKQQKCIHLSSKYLIMIGRRKGKGPHQGGEVFYLQLEFAYS